MAAAGYSEAPLIKKLGITEKMQVLLMNAPENYFDLLQTDISKQIVARAQTLDFIHFFAKTNHDLVVEMDFLIEKYLENPKIIIWVSWYKKSSGIATDTTENMIRNYALKNGRVDIKVCAVSNDWSGLKLVVPKNKR